MRERCRSSEAAHAKVYVRSDEQTRLIRAQMPGALQSCTGACQGCAGGAGRTGAVIAMDEAERGQSGRGGGYIGWRTCEGVISTGKARRVRQGRQSGPSLVSRLPRVTCAVLSSPRPQSRAALVLKFCSHSTLWREPWTRDRVHSSQYEWESHKRSTELIPFGAAPPVTVPLPASIPTTISTLPDAIALRAFRARSDSPASPL